LTVAVLFVSNSFIKSYTLSVRNYFLRSKRCTGTQNMTTRGLDSIHKHFSCLGHFDLVKR